MRTTSHVIFKLNLNVDGFVRPGFDTHSTSCFMLDQLSVYVMS